MQRTLLRPISSLRTILSSKVESKREQLAFLRECGKTPIDDMRVSEILDGMNTMKTVLCETSRVDGRGLKLRGYSLSELIYLLPGKRKQPSLESVLWLLLTGEIPTWSEYEAFVEEISSNSDLPKATEDLLFSLPKEMHPMTQFSIALQSLNEHSEYSKSLLILPEEEHWKPMLEDILFLVSKLPRIAGIIYRNTFKDGKVCSPGHYDLAENYGRMLGWKDESFFEALRLFLLIHSDHEGGNVSTHTTKVIGSYKNNAFQAYSAGLNGLAGPIHGLGIQFCMMWLVDMWKTLGENYDEKVVEIYVKGYLRDHGKVPGFGHPVLKSTDTRFLVQMEFADRYFKDDPLCKLIKVCNKVVPQLLNEHGKKNSYANMYLHSGSIFYHYGLRAYEYYCVLFGVARAVGALSNLFWDRALMLEPEQLELISLDDLEA